jgi:hypothetical protein
LRRRVGWPWKIRVFRPRPWLGDQAVSLPCPGILSLALEPPKIARAKSVIRDFILVRLGSVISWRHMGPKLARLGSMVAVQAQLLGQLNGSQQWPSMLCALAQPRCDDMEHGSKHKLRPAFYASWLGPVSAPRVIHAQGCPRPLKYGPISPCKGIIIMR